MSKKDIIKRKKGEVIYEAKIDGQVNDTQKYKIILGVIIMAIIVLVILFL